MGLLRGIVRRVSSSSDEAWAVESKRVVVVVIVVDIVMSEMLLAVIARPTRPISPTRSGSSVMVRKTFRRSAKGDGGIKCGRDKD
jgi:hypothetical protein